MPNRVLTNIKVQENYYQLRAEAVGNRLIYNDNSDYQYFLSLLERSMLLNDSVEALAYCLASNHFCLLLCQLKDSGVEKLMHNIVADYNKYFFNKYKVDDLLSETEYKVSKVAPDNLLESSRKIHTQSNEWIDCEYSSIRSYLYDDVPAWLNKKRISEKYSSATRYLKFLTTI